ncbi:MAG: alpha-L-fucosidase, partial [Prevotella sp.]|nr:alpha-L-fucosidase [Prevotella sp.]
FYPVSDAGMMIAAHFYNHNMLQHRGKNEAVLFGKILDKEQRKALVWDVERGAPNEIVPEPWQTCTCIGGWHYNTSIYERNQYKSATTVVRLLVDVVSKNGNLLLSVPLRADGTFDEKEKAIMDEFGVWMRQNCEAIYDTRPWVRFGEGPIAESSIQLNAQGFNEGSYQNAGSSEIRFTQKKNVLYAIALDWPKDHTIRIKSLGKNKKDYGKRIHSVKLIGYGKVKFQQTDEALEVYLPEKPTNGIAPVMMIR